MYWVLGFLILLIALSIPILAIVLDSPVARNAFRRLDSGKLDDVINRLQALEDEVADLGRGLEALREETQFVQRLLEDSDQAGSPKQLPPPES